VPTPVATTIYWLLIGVLFYLDWRHNPRTTGALWVPLIYFFLIASRPVSMWFDLGGVATANQVLDGSPVDRLAYTVLLLLALVILAQRQVRLRRLLREQTPLMLFVGYCLVSLIWSDYATVAFKRWIKLLTDVVMVWVVVTEPRPLEAVKRFLARSAFVLIPLSVLFIKYYPHLGREYSQWTGQVLYTGVTYNKNTFGALCLYWGLGYVWLFMEVLKKENRKPQLVLPTALVLAMFWWTLTLSGSATSLACFLMGVILLLWTRIRFVQRRPLLFHVPAVAMVSASAAALFGDWGSSAVAVLERDSTLTGRTELWERILAMGTNPILGMGYESFWLGDRLEYLWSLYWWRPNQAHNGYIELYLNLGWAGIATFLWLLATAYVRVSKAVRKGESYASLRLGWIVIAIVYNFTEASFRMQNLAWIFTLFAFVGLPPNRVPGAGGERRTPEDRLRSQGYIIHTAGAGAR
jgi:O-antigen ligase